MLTEIMPVDENVDGFGNAIVQAFNNGEFDATTFGALAALPDEASFIAATESLLPNVNGAATKELYERTSTINKSIDQRLERLGLASDGDDLVGLETGIWGKVGWDQSSLSGNRARVSQSGYEADSYNVIVGYDRAINQNLLLGAAGGYTSTEIDQDRDLDNSDDLEFYYLTAYAAHQAGPVFANGQIGYASGTGDSDRLDPLNNGRISGAYDLSGVSAQTTLGYDFPLRDDTFVSPFATLYYGSFTQDGYREQGGLGIAIAEQSYDQLEGKLGVAFSAQMDPFDSHKLGATVRLAYVNVLDGDPNALAAIVGATQRIELLGQDNSDDRAEYGVSLGLLSQNGFTVRFDLDGESSRTYNAFGGSLTAKLRF